MFFKRKILVYIITGLLMMIATFFALLVLSILVYWLKWQSDKAMAGLVICYIISGFTGGRAFKWVQKRIGQERNIIGIKKKALEALLLSVLFVIFLLLVSILGFHIPFEFSTRFVLIVILITSSCFMGRIL